MRQIARFLIVIAAALPGCANSEPFPALGRQTYSETFDKPADAARFNRVYRGLETWGYFGAEPIGRRDRKKMTQAQRVSSRTWPGILNINVDGDYCPGATTPSVADGVLRIDAYRFTPDDAVSCGHGKPWASAYVSSKASFAQTYGYFEIEAKIPCDPGRWPAFWLLPVAKTPENGGRLAEIDVFEHYGGTRTVQSQGKPYVINRVGQPFSTLHVGTVKSEKAFSNAQKLPPRTKEERIAFCQTSHSYGVLWTPAEFRFYIDRVETFRTPNPGVDDPHYWVLNMDISKSAGDPGLMPGPSRYEIYAVRAWALPGR